MHITLTGNLGSGKSTICNILRDSYGFTKYATGDVQRELAERMGMTTLELNIYMQQDVKYDRLIDDEVVRIAKERAAEKIIFDSRMAWHFVPLSFKVFLHVDAQVAAARVFQDSKRGAVETYSSIEDAADKLRQRAASEQERFVAFYGVNYTDWANYNLVLDSSQATAEDIAQRLHAEAEEWYQLTGVERQRQKLLVPFAPCG